MASYTLMYLLYIEYCLSYLSVLARQHFGYDFGYEKHLFIYFLQFSDTSLTKNELAHRLGLSFWF